VSEPIDVQSSGRRRNFGERLVAALKLDESVFEEVEHDVQALPQAFGIVALAALASGVAGLQGGVGGLFGGVLAAAAGWLFGAGLVWLIGVKALGGTSDYPELLRTIGFASAPQLLLVVGILPIGPLFWLVSLGVFGWSIAAYLMAVRAALDVSMGTAIGVCLAAVGIRVVLGLLFLAG
jgi:hypothetical protein